MAGVNRKIHCGDAGCHVEDDDEIKFTREAVSESVRGEFTVLLEQLCYEFLGEVLRSTQLKNLVNAHRVQAFKSLKQTEISNKAREKKHKTYVDPQLHNLSKTELEAETSAFFQVVDLTEKLEKNQLKSIHMSSLVIEDLQSLATTLRATPREPMLGLAEVEKRYLAEQWDKTTKTVNELLIDELAPHRPKSDAEMIGVMRNQIEAMQAELAHAQRQAQEAIQRATAAESEKKIAKEALS